MDSDLLLMLCVCDGLKIEDSDLFVKEIEDRDLFFVCFFPTNSPVCERLLDVVRLLPQVLACVRQGAEHLHDQYLSVFISIIIICYYFHE